ncbi:MAG: ubiquinol-cytochrome c reductase iron-sulfur subunit [Pseudomonadales bacterium]|nr:ubiquinol-cytochrome c reductase iron-sulfur subunit [Pseudomonadales bacterium]MBO7005479.1 ubiquinol-cytochrome c reductase iron-sulfur subunit [Pseudomonadales bacterium]
MNRRTLLTRIVAGFSAIALAGFTVPFLRSWFPGFDEDVSLDVDVSELSAGDVKTVRWLGRNVLVVGRDRGEEAEPFVLEDPGSENSSQPEFAENTLRARRADHLVVFSNCTHLGCEVEVLAGDGFEGFSCPCHRSRYDTSGRVEKGAAAKRNLEVPEYDYIARTVIRLRKV